MNYKEFTGKTVEEAVENGLKELGIARENAQIRILEEGKKKLFGSVKARVEIAVKNEETIEVVEEKTQTEETKAVAVESKEATDGERAVAFLDGLFELLEITACTELVSEGNKIEINVTAGNTTSIIGKRGETLDAIQTLAGAVANIGRDDYKRVVVDCENYRETREGTLKRLAENLAAKATRLQKKIMLEPMNPYERRIIHSALSEIEGVSTQSEGKEPNRYIVVIPDNLADPDAPAISARNDRGGRNGGHNRSSRGGFNRGNDKKPYGNRGGKKPYNNRRRDGGSNEQTGGTTMKKSDFFGTFLGNSKDNQD